MWGSNATHRKSAAAEPMAKRVDVRKMKRQGGKEVRERRQAELQNKKKEASVPSCHRKAASGHQSLLTRYELRSIVYITRLR